MQLELAQARQDRLTLLAARTGARARRVWDRNVRTDLDVAWQQMVAELLTVTTAAQVAATAGASTYLAATANADGVTASSGGVVQPGAWAGVDASGRSLEGLLYGAVTTAKTAIGAGQGLQSAFMTAGTYLAVMTRTAVLDTGRSSDLTAMTARSYTHYVRVVSPGACSRCAILAGIGSAQRPFKRHPACRCTAAPVTEEGRALTASSRFADPTSYFESLSAAEQDRVFTNAGAEAIRAGADPITVVSARRGGTQAYSNTDAVGSIRRARLQRTPIGVGSDGKPILGYTTSEGTTRRGAFGKQNRIATGTNQRRIRLMPETIIGLTDDVELRQVLLRDAGYLRTPVTAAERSAPLGGGYAQRVAEQIREDRGIADRFYREHGITLG